MSLAGTFRQTLALSFLTLQVTGSGAALADAVVLSSVSLDVARVLGSVIGGALVAAVGIPVCFLINAASFIAVVISLARTHAEDVLPTALPLLATGAFPGTAATCGFVAGVMALWALAWVAPTVVLGLLVHPLVSHRDQIAAVPDDQSDESDACPEDGSPNAA